jgi:hypothetical protein
MHSGGSRDIARRLVAARSDQWGAARRLAEARSERWSAVISRRLSAAMREEGAARVVP